jgi:DNA modification methylase
MKSNVLVGNNIDVLKQFPDNHFDSVVTDPPYGIDFLGKSWDANTGALETYQECLRVLKPGGHLLAFSAARTYHHLAVTVEQAGFEIRDQIMWIYSSGFPKSQDIGRSIQRSLGVKKKKFIGVQDPNLRHNTKARGGDEVDLGMDGFQVVCTDPIAKQWEGWGTALKPAHEPIVLARKPTKLSIVKNVQIHGVGALNIRDSRIGNELITTVVKQNQDNVRWYGDRADGQAIPKEISREDNIGRYPNNVLGEILQDDYQKYFYCPKVGRKERHIGFELTKVGVTTGGMWDKDGTGIQYNAQKVQTNGNNHPTVKPIELMKYLIKLVTPPGGHVLDPFNGSGSTGCAAVELDYEYTGIELDPKYAKIARTRIEAWYKHTHDNVYTELFETN